MYNPTTRLLTILELLQSRDKIGGPELARLLEVDTRSVRRYMMMLQDLGIPIVASRGRYGTYKLGPVNGQDILPMRSIRLTDSD